MVKILHGDCLELLPEMAADSLDCCITDPPYHLTSIVKRFGGAKSAPAKHGKDGAFARASRGFMGQTWDGGDIAFRPETWAEVYRVLKPGAHLAAFGGTRTFHRMMVAIEDAGFEVRNTLMWLYGTGFPKSHDVSKGIDKMFGAERPIIGKVVNAGRGQNRNPDTKSHTYRHKTGEVGLTAPGSAESAAWEGWGTDLKPAWEPIALFRKPLAKGLTVAQNVLAYGTGAINIDACRIETDDCLSGGAYAQNPTERAEMWGENAGGSWRRGGAGEFVQPAGRWPANVAHDGSDEVLEAFPNGAARFFYCAKANAEDRAGSKHPTVKPVKLMRWMVKMVTPPGGGLCWTCSPAPAPQAKPRSLKVSTPYCASNPPSMWPTSGAASARKLPTPRS